MKSGSSRTWRVGPTASSHGRRSCTLRASTNLPPRSCWTVGSGLDMLIDMGTAEPPASGQLSDSATSERDAGDHSARDGELEPSETATAERCRQCGCVLADGPRPGPFGFGLVRCQSCRRRHWYPLSAGLRAFFWVVLVLTALGLLGLLGSGIAAVPGSVAVIASVLLVIDANIRARHVTANAITAVTTAVAASSLMVALFAVGVNNGYTFIVVDRPAEEIVEFVGVSFESGDRICGGGADYQACAYMHASMYNSVCTGSAWRSLTDSARRTCDDLSDFVDGVIRRSATCGFGCTTQADSSGRWGWSYLRPVAQTVSVSIDRVTHQESCWFRLGPLQIGSCPRD